MMIRDEGFAIRYEFDEDETAAARWDYSHLLDGDPLPFGEAATTTRATQKKAKREDYQPQLF